MSERFHVVDYFTGMFLHTPKNPPQDAYPTGWGDELAYHDQDGTRHIPPRTKFSHPYSYDPIVLFDTGEKSTDSAYSDRMSQWNYEKFRASMKDQGEMHFSWHSKDAVQKFLRAYYSENTTEVLHVTRVVEMCNASSGYPVWFIEWKAVPVGVKKPRAKKVTASK